jgi:hypothetical protein
MANKCRKKIYEKYTIATESTMKARKEKVIEKVTNLN